MLSILEQEPASIEGSETGPAEPEEFEIVLGRAQIASWLFVMVIALAICSSVAYLVGKSAGARKTTATAVAAPASVAVPTSSATVPSSSAMPTVSIIVPPKTDMASLLKSAQKGGPPLFAEPEPGKVYIQIGAVEKGMATILAEGLRSHGFDAFVGAGPSEKIFRVLIGPLPDPESFRQAKAAVDAIDLTAFARKYEK